MPNPHPPLVSGSGLIDLPCAGCTVPFRRGDVVCTRVVRVTPGPGGCQVDAVLVHHECTDPQGRQAA